MSEVDNMIMRWVSVRDGMPDVGREVFLCLAEDGLYIVGSRQDDDDWPWETDAENRDVLAAEDVTHWCAIVSPSGDR